MAGPSRFETGRGFFELGRSGSGIVRPCPPLTHAQIAARNAAEASFIRHLGETLDSNIPARVEAARAIDPSITLFDALNRHAIPPDILGKVNVASET